MSDLKSGYYRMRNASEALAVLSDISTRLPLRGLVNINSSSPHEACWGINGRHGGNEEYVISDYDLIKFLRPYTPPEIRKPDVLDGVGTYESENGHNWVVYYNPQTKQHRAIRHEDSYKVAPNGELLGSVANLVKKISDGIEL